MRRREFIAAGAGMVLLRAQPAAGQKFKAGIVPANAGKQTSADAAYWSNCDAVAALGFHCVEFNDTRAGIVEAWSARASEFKDQMGKRGLVLSGAALFSHIADAGQTRELIDHHMLLGRFLQAVGGSYITHMIAPGAVLNEAFDEAEYARVDVKVWARHANEIGRRLAEECGVSLAYHPEQGEIRSGLCERILDAADERWLRLLVDTGHVASAGRDGLSMVTQYRSRLACVHLKDFSPDIQPRKAGNAAFGEGQVNLGAIVALLHETGFAGWVMAESGGTNEHMHDYMAGALGLTV